MSAIMDLLFCGEVSETQSLKFGESRSYYCDKGAKGPTEPETPKNSKYSKKVTLGVDPKVTKKQLKSNQIILGTF